MEKWNITQKSESFSEERLNCYWFWFKGKIDRRRNKQTSEITERVLKFGEWKEHRLQKGFQIYLTILLDKYMRGLKEGKYNGQTKSEFEKNFKRVSDIWVKSDGDVDKAISLAKSQATRISDEWKAINRAMAAKEKGYEEIFEVFFHRAYELGSVSKQEYREYKLEKLGI